MTQEITMKMAQLDTLSPEEQSQIELLAELGFAREDAAGMYLACGKNAERAAEFMFSGRVACAYGQTDDAAHDLSLSGYAMDIGAPRKITGNLPLLVSVHFLTGCFLFSAGVGYEQFEPEPEPDSRPEPCMVAGAARRLSFGPEPEPASEPEQHLTEPEPTPEPELGPKQELGEAWDELVDAFDL